MGPFNDEDFCTCGHNWGYHYPACLYSRCKCEVFEYDHSEVLIPEVSERSEELPG